MSSLCRPEQLFSLDMLAAHLPGFQPPHAPHDPAGDWELMYRQYCLAALTGFGGQHGTVRIRRRRGQDGAFSMRVQCERRVWGKHIVKLAAELDARAEPLPRPLRWSWQSEIVEDRRRTIPESQLQRSAALEDGTVKFSGPGRKLLVDGPCTVNWLLFEAVGRLPREAFPPLHFTLLDQLDEAKPHHTLSYAETLTVQVGARPVRQTEVEQLERGKIHTTRWAVAGGQPVRLHVYHQLGDGNLPWVYWVDDQGRLLFAVAGFEAYALDSFDKV
jgi:hypothetical protein